MVRQYTGDTTQVTWLYESGTFATVSGPAIWPGLVQSHDTGLDQGVISVRYAGGLDRNVGQFVDGGTNYTGTLSYYPQNWRLLKFALGKCTDGGSPSPYTHTLTEANNDDESFEIPGQVLPTFSVEDAKILATGSNNIVTLNGCMINSFKISASEGEPITVTADYVAKTATWSSGAAQTVTADTSTPFIWHHGRIHLPSGTTVNNVLGFDFSVSNNLDVPNYVDGSRNTGLPIPQNRDYALDLTVRANANDTKAWRDQYHLGGSTFNMLLPIVLSAGSREVILTLSGCKVTALSDPTPPEGVIEQSITVTPQSVTGIVSDSTQYWNLWSGA